VGEKVNPLRVYTSTYVEQFEVYFKKLLPIEKVQVQVSTEDKKEFYANLRPMIINPVSELIESTGGYGRTAAEALAACLKSYIEKINRYYPNGIKSENFHYL